MQKGHLFLAGLQSVQTSPEHFLSNSVTDAKLAFVCCRPTKRAKRPQGISSALQSQRQAWMSQLTADAAQEVLIVTDAIMSICYI